MVTIIQSPGDLVRKDVKTTFMDRLALLQSRSKSSKHPHFLVKIVVSTLEKRKGTVGKKKS